jgi:aspartyl-tRNA(Asn)/glutamyl-tRNA(Gln) amidotransferase subunit C
MQVTPEIFDHVAKLAKLRFADDEKEALREEMQKMVSFVEKLNELDTEGVEPLTHMSHVVQSPREDIAKKEYSKSDGLKNALVKDEHYFLVPKVIENPNK